MIVLGGRPVTGQTLDQVKDLLLQQVDLLKKGEFPDWLLEAAVNNARFSLMKQNETNQGRAMAMANSYLDDIPYAKYVETMDRMKKVTKKELIDFANRFMDKSYVVVYKKQGTPEEIAKIKKPPITPVYINRESESDFLKKIRGSTVSAIAPVFIDYNKDILRLNLKGNTRVLYKANEEDGLFQLTYYFKTGRNSDRLLNFALAYLPYLGTSAKTLAQVNGEFYRLACSFNANPGDEETQLTLTGLSDNFEKALALMEEILTDPKCDSSALKKLVNNTLRARKNSKSSQNEVFAALTSYGTYGEHSPYKNILSEQELRSLNAVDLTKLIRNLDGSEHQVLYYGPEKPAILLRLLGQYHKIPASPAKLAPPVLFPEMETSQDKVLFVQYDAKQARTESIIRNGRFDPGLSPVIALYNNYFGSNIVFQELREKRALAYTAYSRYQEPNTLDKSYLSVGYIASQNDKVIDALTSFNELYDNMPRSDITFNVSKSTVLNKICTDRISRMNVIWNFLNAEKLGLTKDIREDIYHKVAVMTPEDLVTFNQQYIKNRKKTYLVLGRENEIDFPGLAKFGPVTKLTLEDIFGY
jgi:predicted Zn-dependent peptidase